MAAARKSHRYLVGGGGKPNPGTPDDDQFELDEADVWSGASSNDVVVSPETKNLVYRWPCPVRKPSRNTDRLLKAAKSLPVNIPDWSKILGSEYKKRAAGECGEEEEEDEGNGRLPPHEYLARTRGASLSVHEGVGRTLKGRDLSRVRNAIWKQTGFED